MQRRAKMVPLSSDPAIIEQEIEAQDILRQYVDDQHGNQKRLALDTGINATFISRLCNKPGQTIALETAILIELATGGKLRAESLCPARAEVIRRFLAARTEFVQKGVAR